MQAAGDAFAKKTDKGSSDLYFYYYGMLQHQQNMLQDYIRTGTYWSAIIENAPDFQGKVVMDVGAGSGILSLFAAQVAPSAPCTHFVMWMGSREQSRDCSVRANSSPTSLLAALVAALMGRRYGPEGS